MREGMATSPKHATQTTWVDNRGLEIEERKLTLNNQYYMLADIRCTAISYVIVRRVFIVNKLTPNP
jgi:hypothetical protein